MHLCMSYLGGLSINPIVAALLIVLERFRTFLSVLWLLLSFTEDRPKNIWGMTLQFAHTSHKGYQSPPIFLKILPFIHFVRTESFPKN